MDGCLGILAAVNEAGSQLSPGGESTEKEFPRMEPLAFTQPAFAGPWIVGGALSR